MSRPSQAALEAAVAFQAPLDVPPKRRRPGSETGAQFSLGNEERLKNTRDIEETQARLGRAFAGVAGQLANLRRTDDPVARVDAAAHVLRETLGPGERGWLLMVAAQAAEPNDLEALASRVVESGFRGALPPVFDCLRAEAKLWSSFAGLPERRAYLAAVWQTLPQHERSDFLRAVS